MYVQYTYRIYVYFKEKCKKKRDLGATYSYNKGETGHGEDSDQWSEKRR
jgi:hypothetical protein